MPRLQALVSCSTHSLCVSSLTWLPAYLCTEAWCRVYPPCQAEGTALFPLLCCLSRGWWQSNGEPGGAHPSPHPLLIVSGDGGGGGSVVGSAGRSAHTPPTAAIQEPLVFMKVMKLPECWEAVTVRAGACPMKANLQA